MRATAHTVLAGLCLLCAGLVAGPATDRSPMADSLVALLLALGIIVLLLAFISVVDERRPR
jgi:hypothetical protein